MAADAFAREWVGRLEGIEARKSGRGMPAAREALARRLGVPAGTLENIRRGRSKGIRAWLDERIRAAVIRELTTEILRLEHEVQVARQCGAHPGSTEILEAEAALEKARASLRT
ncbi:MAG: hypothetical protein U1E62_05260 [Alsobacter sp.]